MRIKSFFIFGMVLLFCFSATGQPEDNLKTPGASTSVSAESQAQQATSNPSDISQDATQVPKIVIEKAQHNFGSVVEGQTVVQEFIIFNKGTATLSIEKVKTG